LVNSLEKKDMEAAMALVTELRRRKRFLRQEGGLTWTVVAVLLSAAAVLYTAQSQGWLYLF
jgi:hypothetical protein